MVGRLQDAHNEFSAPALMEETPKALRVAVVEDDPRIQQLISGDDNLLDVYIRYLRQKVELDDAPTLINTVRGVGFILREQTN